MSVIFRRLRWIDMCCCTCPTRQKQCLSSPAQRKLDFCACTCIFSPIPPALTCCFCYTGGQEVFTSSSTPEEDIHVDAPVSSLPSRGITSLDSSSGDWHRGAFQNTARGSGRLSPDQKPWKSLLSLFPVTLTGVLRRHRFLDMTSSLRLEGCKLLLTSYLMFT